jgi:sec-independent protein translocase protein TatB
MLDVGFSEILLTSAIALIVLGPEKLPKVARQVGSWVGRARAMARQLTEQLEREVTSAEELMNLTKSNLSISADAAKTSADTAKTSAPATFDTSYTPNVPPPPAEPPAISAPAASAPAVSAPAVSEPAATYSPETAATVHGADWHASPPENKPTNE